MSLKDPYHGDPWVKKGREHADDGPVRRAQYKAAFRQTRKKARTELKKQIEKELIELDEELLKDMFYDDIDDADFGWQY